ncbi:MAG: hypothetical protein NTX03_09095, partial [Bacteroidetes bacterium]|nr:hypothetical protein [Bacteroidota bacterium]
YNQRGEAYYLDSKGNVMPLSDHYSARVVVASTPYEAKENDSIINHLNAKLFALANAINKDSFLFALTGQIAFDSAQEFSIIPRMGNFEIVLGDTSVLEDKFIRLRSFYKSALPQEGWEKYSTISLKYKHQVIATRKELANE